MRHIDTTLLEFLTASIDMESQADEVRAGIEEAVAQAFIMISRDPITDRYIFPGHVTPTGVMMRAAQLVCIARTTADAGEHTEYLDSVRLALKSGLKR